MIQIQTQLKINENSGIKLRQCLKTYHEPIGKIGDIILVSVRK